MLSVSNSSTIVHKRKLVLELTQRFRTTCQKKGALIMMREQSIEQIIVLSYISVSLYWSYRKEVSDQSSIAVVSTLRLPATFFTTNKPIGALPLTFKGDGIVCR